MLAYNPAHDKGYSARVRGEEPRNPYPPFSPMWHDYEDGYLLAHRSILADTVQDLDQELARA